MSRAKATLLEDLDSFRGQMHRLELLCRDKSAKEKHFLHRGCYLIMAEEVGKLAISVDTMIEWLKEHEDEYHDEEA